MSSQVAILVVSLMMIGISAGFGLAIAKAQENPHSSWAGCLTAVLVLDLIVAVLGGVIWLLDRWAK